MKQISIPNMHGATLRKRLREWDACEEALAWLGRKSLKSAWAHCLNGNWMEWFLMSASGKRLGYPSLNKTLDIIHTWVGSDECLESHSLSYHYYVLAKANFYRLLVKVR